MTVIEREVVTFMAATNNSLAYSMSHICTEPLLRIANIKLEILPRVCFVLCLYKDENLYK